MMILTGDEASVNLHDWTLHSISLDWKTGAVVFELSMWKGPYWLRAQGIRGMKIPRAHPWGASVSINEVRGPTPCDDGASCLTIEMQSGDEIQIVAKSFELSNIATDIS